MKKAVIVATVAAVVGISAIGVTAYARQGEWSHRFWRPNTADMTAFADARIAALRAGLALNAEQEKLWPPVESALRELANKRIQIREQRRAQRRDRAERGDDRPAPPNPIERLRRGADRLTEAGSDLKRLADATEPLYHSLDEAQKRRFNMLTRAGMRGMHRGGRHWRHHGDSGDEGRHMGPGWRHRMELERRAPAGSERL